MIGSKRTLIAALVGIAVLAGIWMLMQRGTTTGSSPIVTADPAEQSSTAPTLVPARERELGSSGATTPRTSAAAGIRLIDTEGKPVHEATVSWTPARAEWVSSSIAESSRSWAEIEAQSLFVRSDDSGAFELTYDRNARAVVWISHPAYAARSFHNLSGGELRLPDSITLESAPPLSARVVDERSAPVAQAQVQQCFSLWNVPVDDAHPESIALRLFQRRQETGPDGLARLAGLRGYACLMVSSGDKVSNPWTGYAPAEARLVLRSSFIARGSVPPHPDPAARRCLDRVFVSASVDNSGEEIGYLTVRPDGTFGPVRLPCLAAQEYLFTLESDVWMAHRVRRPAPRPDELVQVDFPGERGLPLSVQTVEADGTPVAGVRVGMSCEFEDTLLRSEMFTGADGVAKFATMRPGTVIVHTNKDGYAPTQSGRFSLFADPGIPYRVELHKGSTLRGRVKLGEKPVNRFTIHIWNEETLFTEERHFQDRADGSFEITDAPTGEISLVAHAPPNARSEQHDIVLAAGQVSSVDIELSGGLAGAGRILSAANGEPIAGATVQPYLFVGQRNLGPFGPAAVSGPDGSFESTGFGGANNACLIRADGFAQKRVDRARSADGVLDFGWIALQRPGRLEIEVRTGDAQDLCRYAAVLRPGDLAPRRRLDGQGKVTFDELSPSRYQAEIWPDPRRTITAYIDVPPGPTSRWVVDQRAVRDLTVEVIPDTEAEQPGELWCNVMYISAAGREEWYFAPFDDHLRCDLSRIPSDSMVVDVVSADMRAIATKWIRSSRSSAELVRIRLGGEPLRLRLRSSKGEPVFPANVLFSCFTEGMNWYTSIAADERGELSLQSVPECTLTMLVTGQRFRRWIKGLEVPARRDEVVEVVVPNDAHADLRLLDRTTPLVGLRSELFDPLGLDMLIDALDTGPDGRVHFSELDSQEFELRISVPGHWPTRVPVTPSPAGVQQDVQVRRLGGARVRATIVGTPMRKKPVGVRSLEFDTDVADWIAAGRVQASSGKLETDADGRLSIDGLPNGPYRWTAKNSSGELVSGDFTVPPRAVTEVNVALP